MKNQIVQSVSLRCLNIDGRAHTLTGDLSTVMAGLACGEPNPMGWRILRDFCSCYVSCDDFVAANGVRILANPLKGDAPVEAGESGAVGLGVLDLLCNNESFGELKQKLAVGPGSILLFFNTESATDPESYREILLHGKDRLCPSAGDTFRLMICHL
jgi:diaminopropionate ammonia-lyase